MKSDSFQGQKSIFAKSVSEKLKEFQDAVANNVEKIKKPQ